LFSDTVNFLSRSPLCTWVDRDHSDGIKAGVIGITWPGFSDTGDTNLPDRCGSSFRAWKNDGGPPVKRSLGANEKRKRSKFVGDDRLVISSKNNQTASGLCDHENSFGPDFVSLVEGMHCNMETREVLPLCKPGVTDSCFDLEAARAALEAKTRSTEDKRSKIIEW
jgi:hypothetical protein